MNLKRKKWKQEGILVEFQPPRFPDGPERDPCMVGSKWKVWTYHGRDWGPGGRGPSVVRVPWPASLAGDNVGNVSGFDLYRHSVCGSYSTRPITLSVPLMLNAGKHVLCEKPLGPEPEAGEGDDGSGEEEGGTSCWK